MTSTSQESDSPDARLPPEHRDPEVSATFESPDMRTAQDLRLQGVGICDAALCLLETLPSSHITELEFLKTIKDFENGFETLGQASARFETLATGLQSAAERGFLQPVEEKIEGYEHAIRCHEEMRKTHLNRENALISFVEFLVQHVDFKKIGLNNGRENEKASSEQ